MTVWLDVATAGFALIAALYWVSQRPKIDEYPSPPRAYEA